jgi:hypothetical protein
MAREHRLAIIAACAFAHDGGAARNGGVPLLPPDPPCVGSPFLSLEPNPTTGLGCGLGPELSGLLAALALVRRARRSRARGPRP